MNQKEACEAFRAFMAGVPVMTILVLPGLCDGLAEFPKAAPLRIDLSEAFSPPMWPIVSEDGLAFRASFSRVDRAVTVPWSALVWAGVPSAQDRRPTQAEVAALETPNVQTPTVKEGTLIHVDFTARAKKAGP